MLLVCSRHNVHVRLQTLKHVSLFVCPRSSKAVISRKTTVLILSLQGFPLSSFWSLGATFYLLPPKSYLLAIHLFLVPILFTSS